MQNLINYFVTAFVVYALNHFFYFRSQAFHIRRLTDDLKHSAFNMRNESSINILASAPGRSEKYDLTFWHRSFTFNSNKSPT